MLSKAFLGPISQPLTRLKATFQLIWKSLFGYLERPVIDQLKIPFEIP